jgi:imidazolonepropionase-like amidohydrolase
MRARKLILLWLLAATSVAAQDHLAVQDRDLALVGGTVYVSPTAGPMTDSTVLIHDGAIVEVGKTREIKVPASAGVVDCKGKVITAGFWNSHVHFTESAFAGAASAPAQRLSDHLQQMLTRWGFTTVFDIGSNPFDTLPLRKRIESGELPGPHIYTTAGTIFPKDGVPFYLPPELAQQLKGAEAATPDDAARLARASLEMGGDGIKVFAGSIQAHGKVIPMDAAIIRAAVEVAHAAGKPVFAHPSNHEGTDNALAGGVDVLAHTIPMEQSFTADELRIMKQHHTALIPTISLFPDEVRKFGGTEEDKRMVADRSIAQLKSYFDMGGTILFGTDVGYTQIYDTTSEYEYMHRAGMSWRDILAALTTNPAGFFKAMDTGTVEPGKRADLVVLEADPQEDVRNFARVARTIRAGKVIYAATLRP